MDAECKYEGTIAEMAEDIKAIRKAIFEGNGHPGIMTRLVMLEQAIQSGNSWVDRFLSWVVGPALTAGAMYLIFGHKP